MSGYLGRGWKEARRQRIKDRITFLKTQYPEIPDAELHDIAWELERLAYAERRAKRGETP